MQWEHVDLDNALWTLPKEHTKARRIHDVPLSAQAKAILQKAPRFKQGTHIFTTTSGKIPVIGFSKAKDAIDKAILERRKKAAEKAGLDTSKVEPPAPWTIHDLRRTVATWCADHEVPPHVIGAILNHSPGSTMGITAVYARSRYSKEKRDALTKWADYVTGLTEQKDTRKRRTA
jgi:integrase